MNKSEEIFQILKQRLEEGFYPPGKNFPSGSDLADEFSVNKMTMNKIVSLLVQEQYLLRGTRGAGTRVKDLIRRSKGSIAFLSPLTPYAVRVLQGAYIEACRHNYTLIVESPHVEDLQPRLDLLCGSGVKGVVSVAYGVPVLPGEMILACVDCDPRTVPPGRKVFFINSDNQQGGRRMMEEIFRRGHREILLYSTQLTLEQARKSASARIRSFHEVMKANGVSDCKKRTFSGRADSAADAREFLLQALNAYPQTTLIAADSDPGAAQIHRAALELGIPCPGKIALTGFGEVTTLPIASVNQNPERQGELAVRTLIQSLDKWEEPSPRSMIRVETSLTNVEQIPILL